MLTYLLFSDLIKLTFRPWHLLIHESFSTREVSFENRAEKPDDILTLLANLEESGTGIRHVICLAALGTAINDSAAPTFINLIFALSLMGDMPTNKARTSDNAQKQSASNAIPIFYSDLFFCSLSNKSSSSWSRPCTHHVSSSLPAYIDLILFPYCFRIVSASGSENDRRTIGGRYENDTGLIRDRYGNDTRPIRNRIVLPPFCGLGGTAILFHCFESF